MFNTSLGEVFNISAEPPVLFNTSAEPSVLFNTLREAVGDPKAHETAAREADAITNSQLRPTCASRAHHGPPQPRRAQSRVLVPTLEHQCQLLAHICTWLTANTWGKTGVRTC